MADASVSDAVVGTVMTVGGVLFTLLLVVSVFVFMAQSERMAASLERLATAVTLPRRAVRPPPQMRELPPLGGGMLAAAGGLTATDAAETGHVHELAPAACRRWFGATGRYGRLGVQGDGSCFFASVCAALNKDGFLHLSPEQQDAVAHAFRCSFRSALTPAAYARLSPSYKHTVENAGGVSGGATAADTSYATAAANLCKPHVWADELAIKHVAASLGLNIVFLDTEAEQLYCGVHGANTLAAVPRHSLPKWVPGHAGSGPSPPSQGTVVIAWVGHRHFEPIVRLEAQDAATHQVRIRGVFVPSACPDDAAMVAHLMSTYVSQCGDGVRAAAV